MYSDLDAKDENHPFRAWLSNYGVFSILNEIAHTTHYANN